MTDNTALEDARPEPLVPAEVDLRDYAFTPMFRARLFGSEFHANATDSEWRAGVTLWLKSWDQVPAGTLPTDDITLCRLAELGRDLKAWRKVKARSLHGWRECSDGRLHHEVVAEGVLDAWAGKRKASDKGKAGASKRWGSRNAQAPNTESPSNATAISTANAHANSASNGTGIARAMPSDSNREGKGDGQGDIPFSNENGQTPTALKVVPPKDDPWKAVYDRGKVILGRESGGIITKLRKLFDDKPRKVLAKLEDAAEQREPLTWITAFLWNCRDDGRLSGEYIGGVPP